MKKSITAEFADVCIRVPATKVDRVKSALSKFLELAGVKYSISDDDEDLLTWKEAFPEIGQGDILQGARDREGLTQTELAAKSTRPTPNNKSVVSNVTPVKTQTI
jgi:hypothetical protein